MFILSFYEWKSHGDPPKTPFRPFLCVHPHPTPTLSSSRLLLFLVLAPSFLGGSAHSGRVARKPLASPVDGGFLSRLLTPTQASLARSKSVAALSAEGGDAPGNPHRGDPL